jgi:hypothetical protein
VGGPARVTESTGMASIFDIRLTGLDCDREIIERPKRE